MIINQMWHIDFSFARQGQDDRRGVRGCSVAEEVL